jgi:hypothetical protein
MVMLLWLHKRTYFASLDEQGRVVPPAMLAIFDNKELECRIKLASAWTQAAPSPSFTHRKNGELQRHLTPVVVLEAQ